MKIEINDKIEERVGLVVWLRNFNDQKKLFQYGDVIRASRSLRYVYLYVNAKDVKDVRQSLSKAHFVRRVQSSNVPKLNFTAEHQKELMQELRDEARKFNEKSEN